MLKKILKMMDEIEKEDGKDKDYAWRWLRLRTLLEASADSFPTMELLERLAPEEPLNDDELGGCIWCGWGENMMYFSKGIKNKGSIYSDARPETHVPECPWVQTRAILDKKE